MDWTLEDAKKNINTLIDASLAGEPQRVTRGERIAVVVLAAAEYERLRRLDKSQAPTLSELLLEIPQDDGEFERLSLPARPLDP